MINLKILTMEGKQIVKRSGLSVDGDYRKTVELLQEMYEYKWQCFAGISTLIKLPQQNSCYGLYFIEKER